MRRYTKMIDHDTSTIYYVDSDFLTKKFGNVYNFWALSDLQKVSYSEIVIKKNELVKCRGMLEDIFDVFAKK